jgi:alkanesulfonate monooxygenase SsuD/methylene tetrahydromethanopterin reductase-like flavin-dependent oxidoreductase (luciferase family)
MSNGRLLFGFGAGWYEHEWRAYGYGFPDVPTRMGMFREACEIIHRMWTADKPVFHGKHYTIDGPINEPKGVQKPHPAFWIGGGGEKVTLKLVAKFGDATNMGSADLAQFRHKLEVLKQHCDEVSRDYNEIVRSTGVTVHLVQSERDADKETAKARGTRSYEEYARDTNVGTSQTVVQRLQRLVEAGADYFIVTIPRVAYDQEPLRQFAQEVMPRLRS